MLFYLAIGVVSLALSAINGVGGNYGLMLITLLMFAVFVVMALLLLLRRNILKISTVIVFSGAWLLSGFFLYTGGAEGFSPVWLCVFAAFTFLIADRMTARMFNIALLFQVFVMLLTPLYGMLDFQYTQSFRYRFPVLISFVVLCAWISELVRSQTQKRLVEMNGKLRLHAFTDSLTGVGNRYAFQRDVEQENNAGSLSYAVVDVDHFKNINDAYGHTVGDGVLRELAGILKDHIRPLDRVYRWGGEEFVVVLPRIDHEMFESTLQRLRKTIEEAAFHIENGAVVHVTISIGGVSGCMGLDVNECIKQADKCLYRAKQAGRNRVDAVNLSHHVVLTLNGAKIINGDIRPEQ
jgi:diguanylate cyclase (GGDEF)-like protein